MYFSIKTFSQLKYEDFTIEMLQNENNNIEKEQIKLPEKFDNEELKQFYEDLPKIELKTEEEIKIGYMDKLLERLPKLCSQMLVEDWVIDFLENSNNKHNRSKLENV